MGKIGKSIVAYALLVFVSGCAVVRVDANHTPNAHIDQVRSIYVVHFEPDKRMINEIITNQLNELGYIATTGDAENRPKAVDVVLTYEDRWMWDITMYLLELKMWLENPNSGEFVAEGYSIRTSFSRKSPEYMVGEVLEKLFLKP